MSTLGKLAFCVAYYSLWTIGFIWRFLWGTFWTLLALAFAIICWAFGLFGMLLGGIAFIARKA